MDKDIKLTIIENGSINIIETKHGEYMSLMFLLKDKLLLDGFGECGGVGRCATCIIKVAGIKGSSNIKERNEPTTLSKIGYKDTDIRLSCQLLITKDLNESEIEIINY